MILGEVGEAPGRRSLRPPGAVTGRGTTPPSRRRPSTLRHRGEQRCRSGASGWCARCARSSPIRVSTVPMRPTCRPRATRAEWMRYAIGRLAVRPRDPDQRHLEAVGAVDKGTGCLSTARIRVTNTGRTTPARPRGCAPFQVGQNRCRTGIPGPDAKPCRGAAARRRSPDCTERESGVPDTTVSGPARWVDTGGVREAQRSRSTRQGMGRKAVTVSDPTARTLGLVARRGRVGLGPPGARRQDQLWRGRAGQWDLEFLGACVITSWNTGPPSTRRSSRWWAAEGSPRRRSGVIAGA